MKSKIRIDHLQAEAENPKGIRDLSKKESIGIVGGSFVGSMWRPQRPIPVRTGRGR